MPEKSKYKFTPVLGWSVSRYDTFKKCKRQYYYQYYGKYDKEVSQSKINSLKYLTSIPLEIGNVVHDVIAVLLNRLKKTQEQLNVEKFIDFSSRESEKQIKKKNFFETYYGIKEKILISDLYPKVETCLESFLNSNWKNWVFSEGIKNSDKWIVEPGDFGETRVNGLKAYLKVDFLFPKDGKFVVLDWKTGKKDADKHENQLIGYVYYAMMKFGFYPHADKVDAYIIYLGEDYDELKAVINEYDISRFEDKTKEETENMYKYCCDVANNIPVGKEEFKMTDNLNICRFCNYKELCGRA
ncbi:PD-(D/E)XK nuclease family protein [bacterium]|jgi:CRISPR/Cas system-associated exonuclease Cas4 (RecB family)|nr:PD-(D/E)XK nuclease family protein [bacterium]